MYVGDSRSSSKPVVTVLILEETNFMKAFVHKPVNKTVRNINYAVLCIIVHCFMTHLAICQLNNEIWYRQMID